jgi:DNA-binding GntR family transcriptional regulator
MAERGASLRIASELRRQVETGEIPAGDMLPSEPALSSQFSVARGTIRAALALLVRDGLIEVIPGRGRRVVSVGAGAQPVAAYERIADDLHRKLLAGDFGDSGPLPSQAALVAEHGVSRNTVRRAYRQLVDDGVVVVRQGVGAFPTGG